MVSGCSTASSPQKTTSPPRSTSTSVVSPNSTTTTTASASTTTSAPNTQGACDPSSLNVSFLKNGAGGSGYYIFTAVNMGTVTCQAGGYFGVSVYDQGGTLISTGTVRDPTGAHGNTVVPVAVAPGRSVSFEVQIIETPSGSQTSCPVIGSFHLIPPNATDDKQVSTPASDGYQLCRGTINIDPTYVG